MYGLDILCILSMLGIIGLHIMNNGGLSFISSYCRSWYRLFARRYFCALSISPFACRQGYSKCSNFRIPNSRVMAFFRSGFFDPEHCYARSLMVKTSQRSLNGSSNTVRQRSGAPAGWCRRLSMSGAKRGGKPLSLFSCVVLCSVT